MPPACRVVGGGAQGANYRFLVNFFAHRGASRPSGHTPQRRANIRKLCQIVNLWAWEAGKTPPAPRTRLYGVYFFAHNLSCFATLHQIAKTIAPIRRFACPQQGQNGRAEVP